MIDLTQMPNKTVYVALGKTFDAKDALKAAGMKWDSIVDGRWAGYVMPATVPSGVTVVEVPSLTRDDIIAYLDIMIGQHAPKKYGAAVDAFLAGAPLMSAAQPGYIHGDYVFLVGAELPRMRNKIAQGETYWREQI